MAKFNAKINSVLIFFIILTLLQLVFSKEAILFLIYLLADKANWVLTLSNRYLFQENITFLGEIILFQKVPYEGIWVIQIPFPTTSVQSHSKVMQFKWFFPVLVHMMKIWALQLHTLYCCLAIKKDIIKKTRGRKELFSKEIEGTVSLTFC